MTDSTTGTSARDRDGLPYGMIKLEGEMNWDKWDFRLTAKMATLKIAYHVVPRSSPKRILR